MITKSRVRVLLAALSLANLCFIRVWPVVLATQNDYYRSAPTSALWALTPVLGVVLLALVFLAAKGVLDRGRNNSAGRLMFRAGFVFILIVALNGIRQELQYSILESEWFGSASSLAATSLPVIGGLILFIASGRTLKRRGFSGFAHSVATVLLAMFPFFLLTTTRSAQAAFAKAGVADKPLGQLNNGSPAPYRVVVLVFDGLNFDMPVGMTEFKRLLSTSITWQNAYPRTNRTTDSLPAIITGRPVTGSRVLGANELLLSAEDATSEYDFASVDTLFTKLDRVGVRSGLVGWYHPYCRILTALSSCRWYPYLPGNLNSEDIVSAQAGLLADTIPFLFRARSATIAQRLRIKKDVLSKWHANLYERIQVDANRLAADPSLGMVFIHYPVPHPPFVSSRVLGAGYHDDYDGNVALADRVLGTLREAIEAAGLTDRTAIVLTADHWNRGLEDDGRQRVLPRVGELDHRVRLALHFPGQTTGATIDRPIENVAAHYLALSLFDGSLRKPEDLPLAMDSWPLWIKSSQGPRFIGRGQR